jgi:crotonobetainyl-CoA:carnitine CoA-transferase CaiB-like acyl-CoA transferase
MTESEAQNSPALLAGIRVVELATYIAAPAAAGIMSDWGATVIKIEPPGGDPLRWLRAEGPGGCSPTFETINRGKQCITLDLATDLGREAIGRLIANADVFITNIRPAGLERAGLDWPSLKAINPQLVYASVTGYGLAGPDANTPAFDNAAFWARTGMADVTRPDGSDPFSMRQGSGDHSCALAAALGIMTALVARNLGGGGRLVEASLMRTASYVMGSDFSNHLRLGTAFPTMPRARATNPLNNFYKSSDGRWFFFMPRNAALDWPRICAAAAIPTVAEDPRFATPQERLANSAALIEKLDAAFGQLPFDAIAERFAAADIVWSPVQTLDEFIDDPQTAAAGCFVAVDDGAGGSFRALAPPIRFDGGQPSLMRPVAAFGKDTASVLASLGLATPAASS